MQSHSPHNRSNPYLSSSVQEEKPAWEMLSPLISVVCNICQIEIL